MNIIITLTLAGTDTGPFNLYTDLDNYATPFATDVEKSVLLIGGSYSIPDSVSIVKVLSTGLCTGAIYLSVPTTTTTTTSTSTTSTTTSTSTTSTTTTTTTTLYHPPSLEVDVNTFGVTPSEYGISCVKVGSNPCFNTSVGYGDVTSQQFIIGSTFIGTQSLIVSADGAGHTGSTISVVDSLGTVSTLAYSGAGNYTFPGIVIDNITMITVTMNVHYVTTTTTTTTIIPVIQRYTVNIYECSEGSACGNLIASNQHYSSYYGVLTVGHFYYNGYVYEIVSYDGLYPYTTMMYVTGVGTANCSDFDSYCVSPPTTTTSTTPGTTTTTSSTTTTTTTLPPLNCSGLNILSLDATGGTGEVSCSMSVVDPNNILQAASFVLFTESLGFVANGADYSISGHSATATYTFTGVAPGNYIFKGSVFSGTWGCNYSSLDQSNTVTVS